MLFITIKYKYNLVTKVSFTSPCFLIANLVMKQNATWENKMLPNRIYVSVHAHVWSPHY